MFIYVGGAHVVDTREIVAILDARRVQRAPDTRVLWARAAEGRDQAETAAARALIITVRGATLVPITPATVARRVLERTKSRGPATAET